MFLTGTYNYVLYNAADQIVGVYNDLPDLHRWINETYPWQSGEVSSQGRKIVVKQLLPGVFRIRRVKIRH